MEAEFFLISRGEVIDFVSRWRDKLCPLESKCKTSNPCFWSCKPGRLAASKDSTVFSDSDCQVLSTLFQLCTDRNLDYGFELSSAYASLFVTKGIIKVYMGSDKATEPVGFHVGNNFWTAELPVLHTLLRNRTIDDVLFHIVDDAGNITRTLSLKHDNIDLPLWRRSWCISDGEDRKSSFVSKNTDWDVWRKTPPRPYITYDTMLKYVRRWKV